MVRNGWMDERTNERMTERNEVKRMGKTAICLSWQIKIKKSQQALLRTQWIAKFLFWIYSFEKWSKKTKLIWFIRGRNGNCLPCYNVYTNLLQFVLLSFRKCMVWREENVDWTNFFDFLLCIHSALYSTKNEIAYCNVERAYWPLFIFQCFIFGCCYNLFSSVYLPPLRSLSLALSRSRMFVCVSLLIM